MVRLGGAVSESEIDFGVAERFFYLQVISVFLYNMIAGSFLSQWREIIEDPAAFLNIIAAAVPQTASFFITYLLVAGVGRVMIRFLRIPQLVILTLLSRIASTPRARARMWVNQYQLLGDQVSGVNIVLSDQVRRRIIVLARARCSQAGEPVSGAWRSGQQKKSRARRSGRM
eukprot:gene3028-13052_t